MYVPCRRCSVNGHIRATKAATALELSTCECQMSLREKGTAINVEMRCLFVCCWASKNGLDSHTQPYKYRIALLVRNTYTQTAHRL